MKKILLVALAAAAMVSCSQNEEIENATQKAEIKIGTVVKAGTKAQVTDNTNFANFTVHGYKTADAMSGTTQLATGFIDGEALVSSNNWALSKTYYWPATGFVQFFATSPAQTLDITTTAGYPTFEYTVKDVAAQEDLVAACMKDQSKSKDVITLPFVHLLTQVNFSIKGDTKDFTYTVSKLVIKGAKDKATFTFDGSATAGSWSTPSASSANKEYVFTKDVVVAPTTANADATTKFEDDNTALFMLMPQNLAGVSFDITYTAAPTAKPTEYTYKGTKNVNFTGAWAMGKNIRYTLTLTSDATPVTLGAEVGGWGTETPGTTEGSDAPQP